MTAFKTGGDAIKQTVATDQFKLPRRLGEYGPCGGPTLVVIAGLHGNEPAGVLAVQKILKQLYEHQPPFRGRIIGLAGNLAALAKGVRYIDADMNRLWHTDILKGADRQVDNGSQRSCIEMQEVRELYAEIQTILKSETGPFYLLDLHTTSSISPPFIPFDDTLQNRAFVERFPVPCILGIEEYLPGTLLSYFNRYGVVAFGYEAGQHADPNSVEYHVAMLALSLEQAKCIDRQHFSGLEQYHALLSSGSQGVSGFFEICYRYSIHPEEQFQMLPGFSSFQQVHRHQPIASNRQGDILANQTARIFMPLYQTQGQEGFFLVRPVSRIWLKLSKRLRQWRLERVIAKLPGVQRLDEDGSQLLVDPRTARFLSRQIFHLLGYRQAPSNGRWIRFSRRD